MPASWLRLKVLLCAFVCLASTGLVAAPVQVIDDLGNRVSLAQPAQRIVSLAPHVTELLFAAGAGDKLVGVVAYSDFPKAAQKITSVGSSSRVDFERLLSLKPDLVVVWESGNPAELQTKVLSLGFPVFVSEPRNLDDVVGNIERLAMLAGTEVIATKAVNDYQQKLASLRERNKAKSPVKVFYQIWDRPLITISGAHLISRVIELCGGVNVFSKLKPLAPHVSREAVLLSDPQIIIASGKGYERPEWLSGWLKWKQLAAVKGGHLVSIHPDIIQRHTSRILQGAEQMCDFLDQVRMQYETE